MEGKALFLNLPLHPTADLVMHSLCCNWLDPGFAIACQNVVSSSYWFQFIWMNGHVWNWKLFPPVNVGCNRWIKSCMPIVTKHNLVVGSRLPQTSKKYRKCPCTENTQFLPRNLAPTPHILELKCSCLSTKSPLVNMFVTISIMLQYIIFIKLSLIFFCAKRWW